MLRRLYKVAVTAVLAPFAALAILTAAGAPAVASTPGCTAGPYAAYCGTETDQETPAMSWDVLHQTARPGQPLIAFPNSDNDRALDFVTLAPGSGHAAGSKMFIYAPDGRISNLCAAEPFQGAPLELRWCNGSKWQVFAAQQVGDTSAYEWVNQATGDVVAANGIRSPLTGVEPPSEPGPGVEWTLAA